MTGNNKIYQIFLITLIPDNGTTRTIRVNKKVLHKKQLTEYTKRLEKVLSARYKTYIQAYLSYIEKPANDTSVPIYLPISHDKGISTHSNKIVFDTLKIKSHER